MLRDVISEHFHLVAHDMARAKYRTENGITVNGETSLVNRVLHEGDEVRVRLSYETPGKIVPVKGDLEILYEDEDLICLNKPAGAVVHPSHGHFADTIANYLAYYFQENGEPHEIRSVGRLDKDTSGVITFAKSRTAAAVLAGQTGGHPQKKTYLALASGTFEHSDGTVDAPISREYEEKIRRVVRADGAPAVTHYHVMKQYPEYALLSVTIDTGRTHQIRVHMAHIGHPLLGDPIYGSGEGGRTLKAEPKTERTGEAKRTGEVKRKEETERTGKTERTGEAEKTGDTDRKEPAPVPEIVREGANCIKRAALHAWKVEIRQPFSEKSINLTAPIPEDMLYYIRSYSNQ